MSNIGDRTLVPPANLARAISVWREKYRPRKPSIWHLSLSFIMVTGQIGELMSSFGPDALSRAEFWVPASIGATCALSITYLVHSIYERIRYQIALKRAQNMFEKAYPDEADYVLLKE